MRKCLSFVLFLLLLGTAGSAFAAAQPYGGFGENDDSDAALAAAGVEETLAGVQETAVYSIRLWKNFSLNRVYSRSTITVTYGNWDYLKVGNRLCKNGVCTAWYYYSRYYVGTNIWCGWYWTDTGTYWVTNGYYYFREGSYTSTRTLRLARYL